MAIPLKYNWSNLRVRWRSTIATVLGIALVVSVFIMVLALDRGLKSTYISTGDPRNLIILRKGATAESSSQITREEARRIKYLDGIERDESNEAIQSAEIIVLIVLPRVSEPVLDEKGNLVQPTANVLVRGVSPMAAQLRPALTITKGRMLRSGNHECIVSRRIAERFKNCNLGDTFDSGKMTWNVVGVFDAERSAYESEIWVDAEEARTAFRRDFYGSVLFRPTDPTVCAMLNERDDLSKKLKEKKDESPGLFAWLWELFGIREPSKQEMEAHMAQLDQSLKKTLVGRIETDNLLSVKVTTETKYYEDQTQSGNLFQYVGGFLSVVMSVGAAFACMNTMYAAVGARTREIGTMRVLGFKRRQIYQSFLLESIFLASFGGALGGLLALPMNGVATGMFNETTFAEIAFEFRITGELLAKGMIFAVVMGVIGGLLPARMAARKPVLDALRSV